MTTEHTPVWMVAREGFESGYVTFGPFESKAAAERFASGPYGGHVYDDVRNRRSPCGPWYL